MLFSSASQDQQKTYWVYDLRTNTNKITKKDKISEEHFKEFVSLYKNRKETERFKKFTIDEIKKRDYNLDILWLKDKSLDSGKYEEPEVILESIKESEEKIIEEIDNIMGMITNGNSNSKK